MSVFPMFASRRATARASRNGGSKFGLPALLTLLTALTMAGAADAAAPTVTGFTPPSGYTGDRVTITGTNFDPDATVTIGDGGQQTNAAVFSRSGATQIVVTVGAGGDGKVRVTNPDPLSPNVGTGTSATDFAFGPRITGIATTPGSTGRPGSTITVTGAGFTGSTVVTINGLTASYVSNGNGTQLTVTIPTNASDPANGPSAVVVTTSDGTASGTYDINNIASVAPASLGASLDFTHEAVTYSSGKNVTVVLGCASNVYEDGGLQLRTNSSPVTVQLTVSDGMQIQDPTSGLPASLVYVDFPAGGCGAAIDVPILFAGDDGIQNDVQIKANVKSLSSELGYSPNAIGGATPQLTPLTPQEGSNVRYDDHLIGFNLRPTLADAQQTSTSESDASSNRFTPIQVGMNRTSYYDALATYESVAPIGGWESDVFTDTQPKYSVFVTVSVTNAAGSPYTSGSLDAPARIFTDQQSLANTSQVLAYTSAEWADALNARQLNKTVYVVGQNTSPGVKQVDELYRIQITKIVSQDPEYSDLSRGVGSFVYFVNRDTDPDNAGNTNPPLPGVLLTGPFTQTPSSPLQTDESGMADTFQVRLNSQPTGNVVIDFVSNRTDEASVDADSATPGNQGSITFTPSNWSVARTVTITGLDDAPTNLTDGPQNYRILTSINTAGTTANEYKTLDPVDVAGINSDNDTAGFVVSPLTLSISEGLTGTFEVNLTKKPSANVTIPISSSNNAVAKANKTSLIFNSTNFNTPQVVTVTAVDDDIDQDVATATIVLGVPTTTDTSYSSNNPADVAVEVVDDNDGAHVTVAPIAGLTTSEPDTKKTPPLPGTTARFTVKLDSKPTSDVTVTVQSGNAEEGLLSIQGNPAAPAPSVTLTFTPLNYRNTQTVVITGQDDLAPGTIDGDQAYTVMLDATSSDSGYNGLPVDDVSVTNLDRDSNAAILVTPASGLVTSEAGQTATFDVKLATAPAQNVSVALTSSDTSEGTVPATPLTFTPANWNTAQTVTVTGVDDTLSDGAINYTINLLSSSSDSFYDTLAASVAATNKDNDIFIVTANPTLTTNEAGTVTAKISVRLSAAPSGGADVLVYANSSDTGEGSVPAAPLSFNAGNFGTNQDITVTGVDDFDVDGPQLYNVSLTSQSLDPDFDGLTTQRAVTNTDDDKGEAVVAPQTGIKTSEQGGSDFFTVVLTSRPTQDVTIGITSLDTTEATVSPSSLTFTSGDWNSPQTVSVTGVSDLIVDADTPFTISTGKLTSGDPNFNTFNPPDVKGTNTDYSPKPVVAGFNPPEGTTGTVITVTGSNFTTDSQVTVGGTSTANFTYIDSTRLQATVTGGSDGKVTVTNAFGSGDSPGTFDYTAPPKAPKATTLSPAGLSFVGLAPSLIEGEATNSIVTLRMDCAQQNYDDGSQVAKVNSGDVFFALTVSDTAGVTSIPPQLQDYEVVFPAGTCGSSQTITIIHAGDDAVQGGRNYTITASTTSQEKGYTGLTASITGSRYDVHTVIVGDPNINRTSENDNKTNRTSNFSVSLADVAPFLDQAPTSPVFVRLRSSDPSEGLIFTDDQPIANEEQVLRFDETNWQSPQTVFVRGVDDTIDDGDPLYAIRVEDVTSRDTEYDGLTNDEPTNLFGKLTGIGQVAYFTNADNEQFDDPTPDNLPGVLINPSSGLQTSESGSTATFRVRLNSRPRTVADPSVGQVVVNFGSSRTDEVSVSPASLTFTQDNYDRDQLVTVTGLDDTLEDGNQTFRVVTSVDDSQTTDVNYQTIDPQDVSGMNLDNDGAGFAVNPTNLVIDEGASSTFSVRLNKVPANDVIISVRVDDTTVATVSTPRLTFTPADYDVPQVVTVTTNDNRITSSPNATAKVILDPAVSQDASYSGVDPADVDVTVIDNDIVGFTVTPLTGLETTEAGGTATFSVKLNKQPSADVVIGLKSDNLNEGTVSPASLTFTPADYDVPQDVTVKGVNDFVIDGPVTYHILTDAAVSTDVSYNGINPADVTVVNKDDDVVGASVDPVAGLTTSEDGAKAQFKISLTAKPTQNVTIALTSSDTTEGTVSPASVTFSTTNFASQQTVTVTGVDDALDDGDVAYKVITGAMQSADPAFNGVAVPDVSLKNTDNDASSFIVTPVVLKTVEGGPTKTFTVRLSNAPISGALVSVKLTSTNTKEGTITPTTLKFTPANFATPQTVTVTPQKDLNRDGTVAYQIKGEVITQSPDFRFVKFPVVNVTNDDANTSGVKVSPTQLKITEGQSKIFTLSLTSKPKSAVTIKMTCSDTVNGRVSPSVVKIQPAKYDVPVSITVTGLDDKIDENDNNFKIITAATESPDGDYDGIPVDDVSVSSLDNDQFGFDIKPLSGLKTTESGGASAFRVRLTSQPTAPVTIPLSVTPAGEVAISPTSLSFNATNWTVYQIVAVTGLDDNIVDGTKPFTIVTGLSSSTDPFYRNKVVPDITGTNADNDRAGIIVTPTAGVATTEAGGEDTFNVSLTSQPTGNVTVPLRSSKPSEGTLSTSSLLFTPQNFATPQTVTVKGVDDDVVDGNVTYNVLVGPVTDGSSYNAQSGRPVAVTNVDNDVRGVTLTPTSGYTTEGGGTHTSTLVLTSKPANDVTITATSSDTTEGKLSTSVFTFTAGNWDDPKSVTVRGQSDSVSDPATKYKVTFAVTSADPIYNGAPVATLDLTNYEAGITMTKTGSATTEAGGSFAIRLALTGRPASDVTISVRNSDASEASATPTPVVFTPDNFSSTQTVTVKGVDDDIVDGVQKYVISFVVTSGDPGYAGFALPSIDATNSDNDVAGIVVTPTTGLVTSEAGDIANFTVALKSAPSNPVTIELNSSDTTEGTVSPSALTFTAANFNVPQSVSVTGVDDDDVDGDKAYTIITGNTQSSDPLYSNQAVSDVAVTNTDDEDSAGNGGGSGEPQTDFSVIGKTYAFSVPFTDSATASATTTVAKAFTVPPTVGSGSSTVTNYRLERFNPLTQQLEPLNSASVIKRGEGYVITPVSTGTGIRRPADDASRIPTAATTFDVTLRLNSSLNAHDDNNGMNLIGFPFDPAKYSVAQWLSSQVKAKDGTIYPTVTAAANAGVMDSRLFTLDESEGGAGNFINVTNIGMVPFEGYYARTYEDGVVVTLKVP